MPVYDPANAPTELIPVPQPRRRKRWHQRWLVRIPLAALAACIGLVALGTVVGYPVKTITVKINPVAATAPASPAAHKAPPKVTRPAPAPAKTIYVTRPAAPAPAAPPAAAPPAPAAAPAPAQVTSPVAVVTQYYQDLTDHNYAAAWELGGKYIGGSDYAAWVAGYATTASVSVYSSADWGSGKVTTYLSAVQDDGTTRTYYGTYYVSNGVITSANIAQTS